MMVFPEQKFAFYHINKCGGTSVCKMLEGLKRPFQQIGKKHIPLSKKDFDFNDYIVFANIRNPFARIVSIYEYGRQFSQRVRFKNLSFKEFFHDWYLKKDRDEYKAMHEYLFIKGKLSENICLIRMEFADQLWPPVIKTFFGKNVELTHENATEHGDPIGYYDSKMKDIVRRRDWWILTQYQLT